MKKKGEEIPIGKAININQKEYSMYLLKLNDDYAVELHSLYGNTDSAIVRYNMNSSKIIDEKGNNTESQIEDNNLHQLMIEDILEKLRNR